MKQSQDLESLLSCLQRDYPSLSFQPGKESLWSAKNNVVYYTTDVEPNSCSLLLHEVGHAKLNHSRFSNDFGLLKQEVEAWSTARDLAKHYSLTIDEDFIETCLDSYRDWLYSRSTCPRCLVACLQIDGKRTYLCHNCNFSWSVSRERFCRPYRLKANIQPSL